MDLPNYSEAVDMPVPGADKLLWINNLFLRILMHIPKKHLENEYR